MAEEEYEESSGSNPKATSLCEGCKTNLSKYKCPGCSVRSCSLPCVKAHKQSTGCTGKRQMTQIIPLSKFDENLLISDYNLLEDVKRVAESAQRKRAKLCSYPHFRLPFPLKSLRSAAATRRTKVLFLSAGLSKRETNQSFYDNRKKVISWTIEWRFHSTDVVLHDHRVDENSSLCAVIKKHLEPGPWNHRLKQFSDEPLESLKFFIRKFPKGPRSPFLELDVEAPIRNQLADLVIIEYPVIHVFLPSHHYDFEVVKATNRHRLHLKESVGFQEQSPKGVLFREEAIEEENSSDPQVLDLMKYANQDGMFQNSHQPVGTEKELSKTHDCPSSCPSVSEKLVIENDMCTDKAEDNQFDFSLSSTVADIFEKIDFEFDQGLIDSYSDLISESDLNDIFDTDGMLKEDPEMEGKNDLPNSCGGFPLDDLEEGEISG